MWLVGFPSLDKCCLRFEDRQVISVVLPSGLGGKKSCLGYCSGPEKARKWQSCPALNGRETAKRETVVEEFEKCDVMREVLRVPEPIGSISREMSGRYPHRDEGRDGRRK